MASNEIELTFIRCPSCKSLMPSTAHKCGMCGLNMEEEEVAAAPSEKKLRLRQRTTSDFSSAINSREAASDIEELNDNFTGSTSFSPSYEEDLSAYEPTSSSQQEGNYNTAVDDDFEDGFEEDAAENDSTSEPVSDEPARKKRRRRRKKKKTPSVDTLAEISLGEGQVTESELRVSSNWGASEVSVVEQKNEEPISEKREPVSNNFYSEFTSSPTETSQAEPTPLPAMEKPVFAESPRVAPPVQVFEERREVVSNTNDRIGDKMNEANKLLGWFVNYSTDASGKYFEIRNGKKFIGRQQLRPLDLIIPDSAISTPHCLLNAEGGKLGLQDLMSDQGTFVKHAGENEFKRIDSSVILKHGDILKLGTFELIVCLIPSN